MFKLMLKKQLLSFKLYFTSNPRTKKKRTLMQSIGFALLVIFVIFSLGLSMFFIAFLMADSLLQPGFMAGNRFDWLYYAIMGVMAMMLGIVGSVFTTYNSIYRAKDNDLLLSMPIKPVYIIGSRLFSIALLAIIYSGIVYLPTIIIYWIFKGMTIPTIVLPIVLWLVSCLFIVTVSCLLGYFVAIISARFPKNNLITMVLYLIFFAFYFYFCFNMNSLLEGLVANAENIGKTISVWIYPVYLMACGSAGDIRSSVFYILLVIVLFGICWLLLNHSFINIATSNRGERKVKYVEKDTKAKGVIAALVNKETKRFMSSTTYMLNTGLGLPMVLIACVMAVIKRDALLQVKDMYVSFFPFVEDILPAILVSFICMIVSTTDVTAPSISLEGKNLWILRSLPIKTNEILNAKAYFGIAINAVPVVVASLVLGLVLGIDIPMIAIIAVTSMLYAIMTSYFGVMLNLLRPSLDWTNEVQPVKQSIPVFVCLFGGWLVSAAIGLCAFFLRDSINAITYLTLVNVILIILFRLIRQWMMTKGVEIFESL